jgi:DNA-binding transcriptional LysR family regulator
MKANSEELAVFVSVVEAGSITAASQNLNLAASVVSRTLARLEEKVGATLLSRTTRRMHLTDEGSFFFDEAREILQHMEDLEERVSARLQMPTGRLRVSAATPFMFHAILPHVDEFRRLYPYIELQLSTNELNINPLADNIDIAIRIGALSDSTLRARPLGASQLTVVATPEYLARHGCPTSVAALAGHTLLGFTEPECLNAWPIRHEGGDSLPIKPVLSASSGETIRQLTLGGSGIACLHGYMTAQDLEAGRLVKVMPDMQSGKVLPVHAVFYRNSKLSLRTQCFLDFIQSRLQSLLGPPR